MRRMLRSPTSPARGLRNDLYAAVGSEKMFGRSPATPPVGSATLGLLSACTSRRRTALLPICQLVAHVPSSNGPPSPFRIGRPLCIRKMPVNCHPPMAASSARLAPLNNIFPLPNGSAANQLALKLCRTSKLETARDSFRLSELRRKLLFDTCDSSTDVSSKDFENV